MEAIQIFVDQREYLCMHSVKQLRQMSTGVYDTTQKYYNQLTALRKAFDRWVRNKNVYYFQDTFIPMFLVKCLPHLTCQPRFIGDTDYIDGIGLEDIQHSISIGVDRFRRPFLVLAYQEQASKRKHCLTVFQRYTDSKHGWVKSDGCYTGVILGNTPTYLDAQNKEQLINNIICLILGRQLVHNDGTTSSCRLLATNSTNI